jgi:peptidoglycan/xylan/chitin deacetylase (PgdA/CDA1 family)
LNKVKKTIVANASTHSAEPITDSNQTGPDGNGKGKPNILRVITYHRVANLDDDHLLNPRLISATPEVFALQIEHVANNYNAVSIDQVLDVIMNGGQLPDRAVLITFDDAYYDLTEHAWPILKRFQLPGTLFVPTAYPDHPERCFWWDRLYRAFVHTSKSVLEATPLGSLSLRTRDERLRNLKRIQDFIKSIPHGRAMQLVDEICANLGERRTVIRSVLSWNELRHLDEYGLTIAAHTRIHPMLNQMTTEEIREEVKNSQEDLKKENGKALPVFCYPGGGFDQRVHSILQEFDFNVAFNTMEEINDLNSTNCLALRRTNITRRTTPMVFRIRLLHSFAPIDVWRHRKKESAVNLREVSDY